MSDSNIEPKEFHIKLKYKVGSEIHYTTFEKFEFLTIREQNMYDKEKIVKDIMANEGETYSNSNFFKRLYKHLEEQDKSADCKFNIPLSIYYFTLIILEGFINQKLSISSPETKTNFSSNFNTINNKLNIIDELLSKKQLAKNIDKFIQNNDDVDTSDNDYSLNLNELLSLFNLDNLIKSGYVNTDYPTNNIGYGIVFLYKFLYFIFNFSLRDHFKTEENTKQLDLSKIDESNEFSKKTYIEKIYCSKRQIKI